MWLGLLGAKRCCNPLPDGHPLEAVLPGSATVAGWAEQLRFCLCNKCCQEIRVLNQGTAR